MQGEDSCEYKWWQGHIGTSNISMITSALLLLHMLHNSTIIVEHFWGGIYYALIYFTQPFESSQMNHSVTKVIACAKRYCELFSYCQNSSLMQILFLMLKQMTDAIDCIEYEGRGKYFLLKKCFTYYDYMMSYISFMCHLQYL